MRMKVAWIAVITTVFVCSVAAEEPVDFADEILKAAVEETLWVLDPTPTDMLGLTDLVCRAESTRDDAIRNIAGLEYALNLQTLNLRYHLVDDISPLAGLTNLKNLVLNGNWKISDISALSGLSELETLDLTRNEVSDISALSGLGKLKWLSLHRNRISDISALTPLTSLEFLDLRINPLNQEAYDTYIAQIKENNPGIWITHDPYASQRLEIESTIGGSVLDPGEGGFSYEQGATVWVIAEAEPGFVFVNFSGSHCTSRNPTLLSMDQDHEIWANFRRVVDTIYVDGAQANTPGSADENGTLEHPFDTIQEAIEVANDGDCIVVHPGTYRENIDFRGKPIQLTGIDPNDPNGTAFPVIMGATEGPVVSFAGGEDPSCALTGFIITGGQGQAAGAILCSDSSPMVANCLIVGNRTSDPNGAAVYCRNSRAVLRNCTIVDNDKGLRLVDSNVALLNSILWGNGPGQIVLSGTSVPTVSYTNLMGGWPGLGNMDVDPLFARRGYWADSNDPNVVLEPSSNDAVWIAGDYHLQSQAGRWAPETHTWVLDEVTSPCIDAADPLEAIGQEPAPNEGGANMGAYGGTTKASRSY